MRPELLVVADSELSLESLTRLRDRCSLGAGSVLVELTPDGDSAPWLFRDLLRALGKPARAGRPPQDLERLFARAWLRGEGVDHVVVYGAERLADPEVAANLSTNVALVTTTVTLPPKLEELCGRDYARELAFEDLITALPKQPHVRRVDGGELFPVVPDDDFITFRATCRALLEREEFERVDRRLRIGVRATTHWLKTNQPDGEHLADYLRAEFTQLPTTHEKITLIRAAQIACLRGGYLLKVKTSQLLAVLTDENPGMLTPQVAERLRAYTNPIEPALAVVSLACQVNHYSLADIRLEDVSQEAETVRIDGTAFRIPLFARGIVRSQVAVRELNGAGPDEFLFMAATPTTENGRERVSAREIRRLLNQVAIETGVINLQHHTLRDMDAARWMSGRGLSLQRIEAE